MVQKNVEWIKEKRKNINKKHERFRSENSGTGGLCRLKKKIRDLERLVRRGSMPADVQLNIERELQSLYFDFKMIQESKKKHILQEKYKMVRFFEKKKATRYLKRAQKQLMEANDEDERKKLENIIHQCQVDLNYITEFPCSKKYISLYKSPSENSSTEQERIMIWKDIEQKCKKKYESE
ncbi:hypothetical protein T552_00089 [Pneumocystis carinii B80]|uniref:rRNA-processing protein EFG1 n=1 Tax=Pneumocystis carinii (strain B80) TaxID=1408658 RepID=A0A0W4ZSU2_PNEC8|nr:hypothetical protein T552_00089 [Pneumocystis carinii B80]KTW31447.1 hypothetical protein T552_00089 [Pneumocystis carinii B80]